MMKITNWTMLLSSLVLLMIIVSGCEKKTDYDIDFIVQNNCDEGIRVDYTIRICSSIDNECVPEDYSDLINQSQNVELYVKDNITEDGDIENVFYKLNIFKGTEKSNLNFWNTGKLIETKYDHKIEYVLTVDSAFFK